MLDPTLKVQELTEMALKSAYYPTQWSCTRRPPSILMIAADSPQTLKVKQILEKNGCQVYWIETHFDYLARASQTYFDLIVLDIEKFDEDSLEIYKKLKGCPKLGDIPIVILTPHNDPEEIINGSKTGLAYVLTKDPGAGLKLLQIIEQVHYLTYRYL